MRNVDDSLVTFNNPNIETRKVGRLLKTFLSFNFNPRNVGKFESFECLFWLNIFVGRWESSKSYQIIKTERIKTKQETKSSFECDSKRLSTDFVWMSMDRAWNNFNLTFKGSQAFNYEQCKVQRIFCVFLLRSFVLERSFCGRFSCLSHSFIPFLIAPS